MREDDNLRYHKSELAFSRNSLYEVRVVFKILQKISFFNVTKTNEILSTIIKE